MGYQRQATPPALQTGEEGPSSSGLGERGPEAAEFGSNAFAAESAVLPRTGSPPDPLDAAPPASGAGPDWSARCRGATSVQAYAQVQGLLLAWSSWGVEADRTDGALAVVRGAFRASLDALRRGADAMPTDGGTDIDGTIDGYQSLLDQIGDEALAAHAPPGDAVAALFGMVADQLAEFDAAYLAGGSPAADPLLKTILAVLGETIAGDFVDDPHVAAILLRTLMGLIPYVDQAMDLEDIVANVFHLTWEGRFDSPAVWLALVLTLLGCIPEVGSVLKGLGKGGMDLLRQVARSGAGAVPIDKLLELLGDVGKRLDPQARLGALLEQWTRIASEFDPSAIVGSLTEKVLKILDDVESGSKRARDLMDGVSDQARKRFDEVAENARKAKDAAAKAVAEQVDRAKKGLDELVQLVREEIGVRSLKSAIGKEAFERLVQQLGEDVIRPLAAELDADLIGVLAHKLGQAGLTTLGAAKVAKALTGLRPATIDAFRVLAPAQMTEFLQRDAQILEAFRKLPPDEQVELLDGVRRIDQVFTTPNGVVRAGHAVTEHGPHLPDEYLFERAAKLGGPASRWTSIEAMEEAIALAKRNLADPAYLRGMQGAGDADIFKAAFWKQNQVTIEDVLADPARFANFLKNNKPTFSGSMPGAGLSFHPDGRTITYADQFKIVFHWDDSKKLQMLTAYPET